MQTLFADTFYWFALIHAKDQWHRQVRSFSTKKNFSMQTLLMNFWIRHFQIKKIPPQGAGYGNRLLANRWFPLQAYIFRPKGRGITPKLLLKSRRDITGLYPQANVIQDRWKGHNGIMSLQENVQLPMQNTRFSRCDQLIEKTKKGDHIERLHSCDFVARINVNNLSRNPTR